MRLSWLVLWSLVVACASPARVIAPTSTSTPSPVPEARAAPPASIADLLVDIDGQVVVRMSDGVVRVGPIAGPLTTPAALQGAVELARWTRVTCARMADDSARCVDDHGAPVTPARSEGVRFLAGGPEIRAGTDAGPELWVHAPGSTALTAGHLPVVDGVIPTVPALASFELSRDFGCGVAAGGIAFCWGMDVPFFADREPDERGDFGQALFLRPRSVSPAAGTHRVEVYAGGACLYGAGDALLECLGLIDVGTGRVTRCTPSAPCRCGASPGRRALACEGRSTTIDPGITTWVDDVILLAGARCFVTARGTAGCFEASGIVPIADLPGP